MTKIEAIDAKDAVFWPIFLGKLDHLPLLEIRSGHKPVEEVFLQFEFLCLWLLLLWGKVLVIWI